MDRRPGVIAGIAAGNVVCEALNASSGTYVQVSRIIASALSPYQALQVVDTPQYGRMLLLDGYAMTSDKDEWYYHEALVHPCAISHEAPADVLIIGGGDGGAAREVLRHPSVRRVDLVEIDDMVVDFSKRYFPQIGKAAFADPRLRVHIGDGREWVETTSAMYDLIILDLTDPIGPAHALYTVEFYRLCRARLNPGGLIALHAESPYARPETSRRILKTVQAVFPRVRPSLAFVPIYGTMLLMLTASADVDPERVTRSQVESRLASRGMRDLKYYGAHTHHAALAIPPLLQTFLDAEAEVVRDGGPRLDCTAELDGRAAAYA